VVRRIFGVGLIVVCIAAALVLARGYAFASTHGALSVYVLDVSDSAAHQAAAPLELSFRDSTGTVLARADAEPGSNVIYLTSPVVYACHGVETRAAFSLAARQEWDRCFARQSRWISTWIPRVASVDLRSRSCSIPHAPVSVSQLRDDWWLWWVPLRHVGGNPYTYYSINLRFDTAHCTLSIDARA
jgi:hypothetical protein